MSYTNTAQLGTEHTEWLGKLDFYEAELGILEERLAEVAGKNTSLDARAGTEHFQNQFIVQRNNIAELKHAVKEEARHTLADVKQHVGLVESTRVGEHKKIEEDIKIFEKVINEIRQEFNAYLSKWM